MSDLLVEIRQMDALCIVPKKREILFKYVYSI